MADLDYDYLAALVRKVQNGNTDAFAELYTATYQKQYRFACRFMKDPYLAQDVLQEMYILALKNIGTLKNARLFVSWLNQINFRLCFDMYEKTSRDQKELLFDDDADTDVFNSTSSYPVPPLEIGVIARDGRRKIIEQVKALPRKEKQAVILKFYGEMTHDEIAAEMGCSKSTVKRYLAKAYIKLGLALEDMRGGGLLG